jgi:hypothetical protein
LQNIKEDVDINKNVSEHTRENINKSEDEQDFQENKPLKLLKVNKNKGNKKNKTEDIMVFDFEENKEEEINGFYEGEIPLDKEARVIWEFAKNSEG